jgi:hypothetical protein
VPEMKKAYLDIDGVILTPKNTSKAENLSEFLDVLTGSFDCYWLTTHCKGDSKDVVRYLSKFLDDNLLQKLVVIKPTTWSTLKTEAIDLSNDFLWFDDYPLEAEIEQLKLHGKLDCLVVVDLNKSGELVRIINRRLLS